jgi:sulfite reductase alpha subunit-like flavoprotein
MDEYDVMNLPSESLVVMCASTTGQGDAPDNMRSFWSFLLRKSLRADSLVGTSFAVFGLGDSGYAKYNAVAKRLDKRLSMLGAIAVSGLRLRRPLYAVSRRPGTKRDEGCAPSLSVCACVRALCWAGAQQLVPLGLGDDQDRAGYDQALDPWLSSLWDAALGLMPLPAGVVVDTSETLPPPRYLVTQVQSPAAPTSAAAHAGHASGGHVDAPSARRPFMAKIVKNERLTGEQSEKEVRHFELDLEGSGMRYQPGDIVAVQVGCTYTPAIPTALCPAIRRVLPILPPCCPAILVSYA